MVVVKAVMMMMMMMITMMRALRRPHRLLHHDSVPRAYHRRGRASASRVSTTHTPHDLLAIG